MGLRKRSPLKVSSSSLCNSGLEKTKSSFLNNVSYINYSLVFFYNKTRRFLVARNKKILKKKKITSKFWVRLGHLNFLFKKHKNSRMGGGMGSFFSVRRFYFPGSVFIRYYSRVMRIKRVLYRHIMIKFNMSFFINVISGSKVGLCFLKKKKIMKKKKKPIFKRNSFSVLKKKTKGVLKKKTILNILRQKIKLPLLKRKKFKKKTNFKLLKYNFSKIRSLSYMLFYS